MVRIDRIDDLTMHTSPLPRNDIKRINFWYNYVSSDQQKDMKILELFFSEDLKTLFSFTLILTNFALLDKNMGVDMTWHGQRMLFLQISNFEHRESFC